MRKYKKYFLIIIFIIILLFIPTFVNAASRLANLNVFLPKLSTREEVKNKVKDFATDYYASDDEEKACIKTPVFKKDGEYYIGKSSNYIKLEGLSDPDMIFDYDEGDSWNVWMDIFYAEGEYNGENSQAITISIIYEDDGSFDPEKDTSIDVAKHLVEGGVKKIKETVEKAITFVEKCSHNLAGTLMTLILDIIKTIFGDMPQFFINMIVTATDGSFKDWQLVYTSDELKKNGDNGNVNKYINIGEYSKGNKADWQVAVEDVEKDGDKFESFDSETEIPVIKADLYNVAMGHISALDTNFLTGNENHPDGSAWSILRNIAAEIIHMAIYIAATILVVTLIFTGIQIVRFSFTDPVTEKEYQERLQNFAMSVATLIGSVAIMALCIFGSNEFFSLIQRNNDTYELPIRVNVENAGYSFSTTFAGYTGYMASSQNVDKTSTKAFYTFCYIGFVALNVITIAIMVIRMLILLVLSVIGPISAALSVFDIQGPMNFRNWVVLYVIISAVQILMAVGCMVTLKMEF